MRKMLKNKKGFSLVELMIVVVIMGILIAVAIPLYGAITENANNKACSANIKNIKTNAATYSTSYNKSVGAKADIAGMFDDGKLPDCPFDDDGDETDYAISIDTNGSAKVMCMYNGDDEHAPDEDASAAATAIVDGVEFGKTQQ